MVKTIAPSGGLTATGAEQSHKESVEPLSSVADISFDVSPNGAMPEGIPVEPATLLFEPADGGFGDIFGEIPPLVPDPQPHPMPLAQDEVEQSGGSIAHNHATATVVTRPSPVPDVPEAWQTRVQEPNPDLAPAPRPATFGGVPAANGQGSQRVGSQKPAGRRAGPGIESSAPPDFGQAIRSSGAESVEADTSFSDLAEATGIRRSTGPVDPEPRATRPGAPLPTHESLNQHPVLIDGNAPTFWSRLTWPIVVLLMLGILATAGYFLGFQKWLGGKSESPQSATVGSSSDTGTETGKPATEPPAAAEPPETQVKPEVPASGETSPAIKAPEPSPAAAAPPVVMGDVQATHSLQAASFPSEPGAKGFAEKLIRAGVPAYVISVNIPRRGKWFRVRVGQFANPAEATKYATQARQRAKAAGFSLDLIVCDYEKP